MRLKNNLTSTTANNSFKNTVEESALITIAADKKISSKLPVFYNPLMKFNRDMSVLLLNSIDNTNMKIALPLAGTGVRGIRFLKELKPGKIQHLLMNDGNSTATTIIKKNLRQNKLSIRGKIPVSIHNESANVLLLQQRGFDYIDIDPFGSPNPFLDSAIKALHCHGSILAVTATDTSALAGTYPDVCQRKYWAIPLNTGEMHEIGLRILVRKVQLIAMQYQKTAQPIFCYSRDHYYRIFFVTDHGKKKCHEIVKLHGMYKGAGPLWLGKLWDITVVQTMLKENKITPLVSHEFLAMISSEASVNVVGFFDIHELCKREKLAIPRYALLIAVLEKRGYAVSRVHCNEYGIKTNCLEKDLVAIIRKF